ncbi:MAG TPA: hypothetical protein VHC18_25745 [Amycolatopsis sp.]|nr:hypothetical protein [Amycolatopsis sp.]
MKTTGLPARIDWPVHEADAPEEFADVAGFAPFEPAGRWTARHTRWAGLAVGALALLGCLAAVVRSGSAGWAFGLAALALVLAVAVAHGLADAGAGSVYASVALACAFAGAAALPGAHLLTAGTGLLAVSLAGLVTAAGGMATLVAGGTAGVFAVAAALLTRGVVPEPGAAAVLAGAALAALPWLDRWAAALARVPLPVAALERSRRPWAALVRADGLVTGMTAGIAVVAVPCQLVLMRGATTAAPVLVAVLAAGFVLRALEHRNLVRRLALLIAGGAGAVALAASRSLAGPALVGAVSLVVLAVLLRGLRGGTPKAGNLVVVPLVAVVPAVCAVLG